MAKVREVRELGADVVIVRAVVGMRPPGSAELSPEVNAIQSVVMTGQGASLRVALLHNTPAAFHGRPELAEALTRELTDVLHAGRVVSGQRVTSQYALISSCSEGGRDDFVLREASILIGD